MRPWRWKRPKFYVRFCNLCEKMVNEKHMDLHIYTYHRHLVLWHEVEDIKEDKKDGE